MIRPAGFWIGHPGALLPLPGIKGELSRTVERAVAFTTSASGRRRGYLSARRAPLREWKVTIPHTRPDEAATLHELIANTDPPFVWVDPWSRITNLLTPDAAGLNSTLPAGLPRLGRQPLEGGGYASTAVANPSAALVRVEPAPVVSLPVTVSAYLGSGSGAHVVATFLDSNGEAMGAGAESANVSGLDLLRRVSVTATPPTGAAAVELSIAGATVIARPAVTWTPDLLDYGFGGGAAQVILSGLDEAARWAPLGVTQRRESDLSFTVTEVG